MQFRLANEISMIKDAAVLPQLEQFLLSSNTMLRSEALQAVRAINSPHSAPFFLKLLDDPDVDNRFGAMQGLLSIASPTETTWVPSWPEFRKAPDLYAAKTQEWWEAEGKRETSEHRR